MLEFDKASHTYRYEGNIVSGVTSVLEGVGLSDFSMVNPADLEQAIALGHEVHTATEALDSGNDAGEISDFGSAMVCAYISFLAEMNVEILEIEKRVFDKKFMYAGTLDRVAIIKKISTEPVILDLKTGAKSISHPIQTAAYEYAYRTDKRKKIDRYCLYLSTEGYKLVKHEGKTDFDVFVGALAVNNYKKGAK